MPAGLLRHKHNGRSDEGSLGHQPARAPRGRKAGRAAPAWPPPHRGPGRRRGCRRVPGLLPRREDPGDPGRPRGCSRPRGFVRRPDLAPVPDQRRLQSERAARHGCAGGPRPGAPRPCRLPGPAPPRRARRPAGGSPSPFRPWVPLQPRAPDTAQPHRARRAPPRSPERCSGRQPVAQCQAGNTSFSLVREATVSAHPLLHSPHSLSRLPSPRDLFPALPLPARPAAAQQSGHCASTRDGAPAVRSQPSRQVRACARFDREDA